MPNKKPLIAFILIFVLVALACDLPGQAAPTATVRAMRSPTAAYTRTIPPWNTDVPPVVPTNPQPTQPIAISLPSLTPNVIFTLIPLIPTSKSSPTPAPVGYCGYGPDQRLKVGKDAVVCTKKDPVILREQPNRNSKQIIQLWPGNVLDVIGGPRCDGDWSYWNVRTGDKTTGWAAEGGDNVDPYFLCPRE